MRDTLAAAWSRKGLVGVYTPSEFELVEQLEPALQDLIHECKAYLDAELVEELPAPIRPGALVAGRRPQNDESGPPRPRRRRQGEPLDGQLAF